MGRRFKSLLIAAAMLPLSVPARADVMTPRSADSPKANPPSFQAGLIKLPVSGTGNDAACFPPSVFSPTNPYFQSKSVFPASDVKFYIADYTSLDPSNPSESIAYTVTLVVGKCLYQFAYLNVNPGAVELARAIDGHSPNLYLVLSKRGGCSTADKTYYSDPVFAEVEQQCDTNFHGVFVK